MNYSSIQKQICHMTATEINALAMQWEKDLKLQEAYYLFLYNAKEHPSCATWNNFAFYSYEHGTWSRNGKVHYPVNAKECERLYLRALLLEQNPVTYRALSAFYLQENRFLEAKFAIQGALSFGETFYVCNAMGCIYGIEKNYAEAAKWYAKALQVYDPGDSYDAEDRLCVLSSYGTAISRCSVLSANTTATQEISLSSIVEELLSAGGFFVADALSVLYYMRDCSRILSLYPRVVKEWSWDDGLFTVFLYAIVQTVPERAEDFCRYIQKEMESDAKLFPVKNYKRICKAILQGEQPELSWMANPLYVNGYII